MNPLKRQMNVPSPLAIATSSVQRLLKEEVSYHKELVDQKAQLRTLEERVAKGEEDEDGNADFMLRQQRTAIGQTEGIFEPLRKRRTEAVARLEEQIALNEETGDQPDELEQARSVLKGAKST